MKFHRLIRLSGLLLAIGGSMLSSSLLAQDRDRDQLQIRDMLQEDAIQDRDQLRQQLRDQDQDHVQDMDDAIQDRDRDQLRDQLDVPDQDRDRDRIHQ